MRTTVCVLVFKTNTVKNYFRFWIPIVSNFYWFLTSSYQFYTDLLLDWIGAQFSNEPAGPIFKTLKCTVNYNLLCIYISEHLSPQKNKLNKIKK